MREPPPPTADPYAVGGPDDDPVEVETATRWAALREYEDWSEWPMLALSVVWLLLVLLEFTGVATPLFSVIGTGIWVLFLVDFVLRFAVAPDRGAYLRSSTLSAVALLLPALRVFRLARAVRLLRLTRTARSLQLLRLLASFRRGMRTLGATMQRRGLGYVVALTTFVVVLGAAGVHAFESGTPAAPGFDSYWEALWWTAMLLTTLGATYVPVSGEARLLTLLLGVYGLAVFGYIAAALASFFIADEAAAAESDVPSGREIAALRAELALFRDELARSRPSTGDAPNGPRQE